MKSINYFLSKKFLSCIVLGLTLSWSGGAATPQEETEEDADRTRVYMVPVDRNTYTVIDGDRNFLGTIDASTVTEYADGDAHTAAGKTQWRIAFADEADGNGDYVVYGAWSQVTRPDAAVRKYEHHTGAFYHGDSPAANVGTVTGSATYYGGVQGVTQYNDGTNYRSQQFTGEVGLQADFDDNTVAGSVSALKGGSTQVSDRFDINAVMGSDGTFAGDGSSGSIVYWRGLTSLSDPSTGGTVEGRFFNQSGSKAPNHVGGSFVVTTRDGGKTFYASFGGHIDYPAKEIFAKVVEVNISAVDRDTYKVRTKGGELLGTIDSSSITSYSSGDAETAAGKIQWSVAYANGADGDTNFVSYGTWARVRKPDARRIYEHSAGVFYHGDNPTTDISAVTGNAEYFGKADGVVTYNDSDNAKIGHFSGDLAATASFRGSSTGTIDGFITNLRGEGVDDNHFFWLRTGINPDGTLNSNNNWGVSYWRDPGDGQDLKESDRISTRQPGPVSGRFYNQDSARAGLPAHLGGDFVVTTKDGGRTFYAAFGAESPILIPVKIHSRLGHHTVLATNNNNLGTFYVDPSSSEMVESTGEGQDVDTATGKTQWGAAFSREKGQRVTYGYWTNTAKPTGHTSYRHRTGAFYHGEARQGSTQRRVQDVSAVTGVALYTGNVLGVSQADDASRADTHQFSGDLHLKADFDQDALSGVVSNLQGGGVASDGAFLFNLPVDDDGSFDGDISYFGNAKTMGSGTVEGDFLYQDSASGTPWDVGGKFFVDAGDRKLSGAFGAARDGSSVEGSAQYRGVSEAVFYYERKPTPGGTFHLSHYIYDSKTLERLDDFGEILDGFRLDSGDADTKTGRKYIRFIPMEIRSPLNGGYYGVWASSRQPHPNRPYYQRHVAPFYGGYRAQYVPQLTGAAAYTLGIVGVIQYNDARYGDIHKFGGTLNLIANFDSNTVKGNTTSLIGHEMTSESEFSVEAQMDATSGDFSGEMTYSGPSSAVPCNCSDLSEESTGTIQGGFYIQKDQADIPEHLLGSFSVRDQGDVRTFTGAFGGGFGTWLGQYDRYKDVSTAEVRTISYVGIEGDLSEEGKTYRFYDTGTGKKLDQIYNFDGAKTEETGKWHDRNAKFSSGSKVIHRNDYVAGASGSSNFLTYGAWALSGKPDASGSVYQRRAAAFYYGDNPTTDVSSISGTALYTGHVTGVSQSNDPLDGENHGFRGDMSMSANFDSDRITGSVQNLSGGGMDGDSRFSFGADLNAAGTFSGDISYAGSTEKGTLSGGFYNPDGTNAPGHVAGSFDLDSGERTYHGAFGGSFTPASESN